MSLNTKRVVVFLMGLALCVALILVADQERRRHTPEGRPAPIITAENAACVDCHGRNEEMGTPGASGGAVAQWIESTHAEKGVGCLDCHGAFTESENGTRTPHIDSWLHEGVLISNIVTPKDCQSCHPVEAVENMASHHANAAMFIGSLDNYLGQFVTGHPNAVLGCEQCHGSRIRFTKHFTDGTSFTLDMNAISNEAAGNLEAGSIDAKTQPVQYKEALMAEMNRIAADAFAPHAGKMPVDGRAGIDIDKNTWPNSGMGRFNPDGSAGSCNACHSRHSFARALARQPENCGKCHMGPDHPQIEIYNESKHGIAFQNRLGEMNLDGDPQTGAWVVGLHYNAAPTCATCHMSAAPGLPASHDVGLRISWTLRPPLSTKTTSHSATLKGGNNVVFSLDWEEKRLQMRKVCLTCHGPTHVENFYKQYDALVGLYHDKFAKPSIALMDKLKARDYYDSSPFANYLDWIYFELWHHEGRRMRMGASMMGPDYTHWHGTYEVAQHFYYKFLPDVEEIAAEHGDQEILDDIKELLARPEHSWKAGLSPEKRQEMIDFYQRRYGQDVIQRENDN